MSRQTPPDLVADEHDTRRTAADTDARSDYSRHFRQLVTAIANDDPRGVTRALAGGIDPTQPFDQAATMNVLRGVGGDRGFGRAMVSGALGAIPYTTTANGPQPVASQRAPRAEARLVRPLLTTPLGLAAAHGSLSAAEALIAAGAAPWPTPEAVLNEALATMNVTGFQRGNYRYAPVADYDPVRLVDLLLRTFHRSPALSAWDVNPLAVVVRGLSGDAALAALDARSLVSPTLSAMLIDAGYSPDERASAIVTDTRVLGQPRMARRERIRRATRDVGAQVLYDIDAIEDLYQTLGDAENRDDLQDADQSGDTAVPLQARMYHKALWALADQYGRAGPRTAQELDTFVETRLLPS